MRCKKLVERLDVSLFHASIVTRPPPKRKAFCGAIFKDPAARLPAVFPLFLQNAAENIFYFVNKNEKVRKFYTFFTAFLTKGEKFRIKYLQFR